MKYKLIFETPCGKYEVWSTDEIATLSSFYDKLLEPVMLASGSQKESIDRFFHADCDEAKP